MRGIPIVLLVSLLWGGGARLVLADETTDDRNAMLQRRLEETERQLQEMRQEINRLRERQESSLPVRQPQVSAPAPFPDLVEPPLAGRAVHFDDPPADALTARLEELEKAAADFKAQTAALEEADSELGAAIKNLVQAGTSGASAQLFGRLQGDYWTFPGDDAGVTAFEGGDPQDRFQMRRLRVGVEGTIRDNIVYKFELEMANPADQTLKDAYIGFTDLPFLQTVLIGNQKRPYNLDQINSSRYNVFMERPYIGDVFDPDTRRFGICSYGVTDDQAWNWRYGVFNMENWQDDLTYLGDHYQMEIAGRLANTWWYDESSDGRGYAHWAVAGTIAHPDGDGGLTHDNEARFRTRPEARTTDRWLDTGPIAEATWYELLGVEKVINIGPLQIVGEYQNVWLQREAGLDDLFFWGGYVYASWFLTGEHMPWDRETGQLDRPKPFENFFLVDRCCGGHGAGWGAWQIAARYSYLDITSRDITGGVGNSVTLALNWYWNPNAKMQVDYSHGWIANRGPVDGETRGMYDIVGVRLACDF